MSMTNSEALFFLIYISAVLDHEYKWLELFQPPPIVTAIARTGMTPSALRSGRQSAKNDSELLPLLRDDSEPPKKKSTRYDAHTYAKALPPIPPGRTQTLRMRIRNIYHGAQVSLLIEPPDHRGRIKYHNCTRQMRKAPATEVVRLDWMRRLRPKPHRRV
jgi:hypothetical protein